MSSTRRIIAGLGNPGPEYARTYHNAGRIALAALIPELKKRFPGAKEGAYKHFSYLELPATVLVFPENFMNESGLALKEALRHFNAGPESLIALHDDSDLPLGEVRRAKGSGAAGHHGVESLIKTLGTKDFERLRIGIRKAVPPEAARVPAGDFVLKEMSRADEKKILAAVQELVMKLIENPNPEPSR